MYHVHIYIKDRIDSTKKIINFQPTHYEVIGEKNTALYTFLEIFYGNIIRGKRKCREAFFTPSSADSLPTIPVSKQV